MQIDVVPFWLMMVSMATTVLPVPRSPMISSLWPLPMGIVGVDGLDACLKRFLHGLADNDARSGLFHVPVFRSFDGTLSVDGDAETVHDPADQRSPTGTWAILPVLFAQVAFLDLIVLSENDSADIIFFEVEDHSGNAVRELKQLARHRILKTVDTRNTIANGDNRHRFPEDLPLFRTPISSVL